MAQVMDCGPGKQTLANWFRITEANRALPARLHDDRCPVKCGAADSCTGLNRNGPPRNYRWRGLLFCVPDGFVLLSDAEAAREAARIAHTQRFRQLERLSRDLRHEARQESRGGLLELARTLHVLWCLSHYGTLAIRTEVKDGRLTVRCAYRRPQ